MCISILVARDSTKQVALYGVDPRISALPQADYPSPPAVRAPMACCYIGCNTMKHPSHLCESCAAKLP